MIEDFGALVEKLAEVWEAPLGALVSGTAAAEGTLWLFDAADETLRPVANTGSKAATMIAEIRQPSGEGLISMVFAGGMPFCENEIAANPDHSPQVDRLLGEETTAMIAVPVAFADELRGVLSLVQLGAEGDGFGRGDLAAAALAAAAISEAADEVLDEGDE